MMVFTKRPILIALSLLFMLIVSACGSSTSSGSSNATPAATTSSNSNILIKTATATVNGKSETILTDAQGKTLYYFTPDTATTSACTGSCAQNWPPLMATGSSSPISATPLSGKLTTLTTASGNQIEYNGHLLYTFVGDTAPGQTNGDGKLGKWFVATPDLAIGNTTPASTPIIKTVTATINGKSETILVTSQGMTLYYFTPDTASKTACTGDCASTWPPLLFTSSGNPTATTKLPGELEVYPNANGKQVIYNDHPLYTFSGDTAPGQTNGNGVGGKWFVVTPDIPKNK